MMQQIELVTTSNTERAAAAPIANPKFSASLGMMGDRVSGVMSGAVGGGSWVVGGVAGSVVGSWVVGRGSILLCRI